LIGRRLRNVVNQRLGAYNALIDFDPTARAAYQHRIDES
jgi:hypothetical protein